MDVTRDRRAIKPAPAPESPPKSDLERQEVFEDGVLLAEGYLSLALASFRRAVEAVIETQGEEAAWAREEALREAIEVAAGKLQTHRDVHDYLKLQTLDALSHRGY